jgi:hypothetical protein
MTCKTCVFWQLASKDWQRENVHCCENPKLLGDIGSDGDDCMFMRGGEPQWTGPDFGCIHHQKILPLQPQAVAPPAAPPSVDNP